MLVLLIFLSLVGTPPPHHAARVRRDLGYVRKVMKSPCMFSEDGKAVICPLPAP